METELCNMCMITDAEGRVLVQERLPKPSNFRTGTICFSQRFASNQYNWETTLQDARPPLPNDRAHGNSIKGNNGN